MPPSFNRRHTSRRRVLRAGGATLAASLSAFGAGCSGLPPLGTQIQYGAVDVPEPDAPSYRDWLPAPSALPDGIDADDGYTVVVSAPPSEPSASVGAGFPRSHIVIRTDYVGVDIDDVDLAIATDPLSGGAGRVNLMLLLGDINRRTVRETLAATSYEPAGSIDGTEVYTRADVGRSVLVADEGVLFAEGEQRRDLLAAAAGAGRGTVPRYHERDENTAALTAAAGMRRWAWLWPTGVDRSSRGGILEDTVGWATTFERVDGSAYFVQTWLFPPDYGPTEGGVKRALKRGTAPGLPEASEASAVDITVEGRVVTIAVYLAPDVADEELSEPASPVPYVTWSATYDDATDSLTVRHEAGDPVRTDWLRVEWGENTVPASSAGDVGDRLEPGEELTVSVADAPPDTTVRLVYEVPDEVTTLLFEYDLP